MWSYNQTKYYNDIIKICSFMFWLTCSYRLFEELFDQLIPMTDGVHEQVKTFVFHSNPNRNRSSSCDFETLEVLIPEVTKFFCTFYRCLGLLKLTLVFASYEICVTPVAQPK